MKTIEDVVGKFEMEEIFRYVARHVARQPSDSDNKKNIYFRRDDTVPRIRSSLYGYLTKQGKSITLDHYLIFFPSGAVEVKMDGIDIDSNRANRDDSLIIQLSYQPHQHAADETGKIKRLKTEILAIANNCAKEERDRLQQQPSFRGLF